MFTVCLPYYGSVTQVACVALFVSNKKSFAINVLNIKIFYGNVSLIIYSNTS